MEFKICYYKDLTNEQWDNFVTQVDIASYYHSWQWLNYCSKFLNIKEHCSFVLLNDNGAPIAICPLAITTNPGKHINEISFSGIPAGIPAINENNPSLRRKILSYIFTFIEDYAKKYEVMNIKMIYHSLNRAFCQKEFASQQYSFELLRYGMHYYVNNSSVINLNLCQEKLSENLSKYHRRHIMRGAKKGIYVKVFNQLYNKEESRQYFNQYQKIHLLTAGKMTRPQETWDEMYNGLLKGCASLFVAFVKDTPISYLYCGEFSLMAFGWSQVNVAEYEEEYSPRHTIEWEAILYYQNQKFNFYEVGEIFYKPQFFYLASEKEKSISILKERFGGFLVPKVFWIGYFNNEFKKEDLISRLNDYLGCC